jgi:serine/threonine protein kinase
MTCFYRNIHPYEIVNVFCDVMRGISEIHARGCLHCDVKLENYLYRIDKIGKASPSYFCVYQGLI